MRGLRVRLLGGFEVEGVDPRRFGSRKARTVLKVLATARGAPVSVDRLADCVWGDDRPNRPADQLAVLVSRARAVLGGDRIPRSEAGYALRTEWLDIAELETRTHEAAALLQAGSLGAARAVATAALSLVRGEPLADEVDAEWAERERAAVERVVARARAITAEAALRSGDPVTAAEHASALLDRDPYDEAALRLVMRAHVAAGRPGSALAAYARVREQLAEDLGASPTAETEALHTAIVCDEHVEPTVRSAPSHGPDLPGRADQLAALDVALEQTAHGLRLVVVEGEAGIGKTALVNAWARRTKAMGTVLLEGRCDPLGRALPLQPVADAIDQHLRPLDPDDAAAVLGEDADAVAPILGRVGGRGEAVAPHPVSDPVRGLAIAFEALLAVIVRAGEGRPVALVLDDIHAAGPTTLEWLHFAVRRGEGRPLLVVVTRRPEEGPAEQGALEVPHATILLGPLDATAAAEVVGAERAPELHARSGGHPLFLVELAGAPPGDLPASIQDAVARQCESAGAEAAATLRTAALLGPAVDVDLLAAVLALPPTVLIDHLETGVRRRLLEERPDGFVFRHDLLQEALLATVSSARQALVHREAAATLARRSTADPLAVADHARLGGDIKLEAGALLRAAAMTIDRFDYAGGDQLLTRAIKLDDTTDARLLRARVRLMVRQFEAAHDDAAVALAAGGGAVAMEVAAWIAYYRRDLDTAIRLAADGARLAETEAIQGRCLTVLGRAAHSKGDVDAAEGHLRRAVSLARGRDAIIPSVWLGSVLTHQGELDEAIDHLHPATRPGIVEPLSLAPAYAAMFGAYAFALRGRPLDALALIDPAIEEVRRRQVSRLAGVPDNFRAWILRNLGAFSEADDTNLAALEAAPIEGEEPNVHAELDLAAGAILAGDADGARLRLALVDRNIARWRTFVWRTEQRRLLLAGRVAMLEEDWALARGCAADLRERAAARHAPRYVALADVLDAEAALQSGDTVDRDAVDRLLAGLPATAALEAWWLTAAVASAGRERRWRKLAEERAAALAKVAGPYGDGLRRAAERRTNF